MLSKFSGQKPKILFYWMRRDLRLEENPVLSIARDLALKSGSRVLPIFIFDPGILGRLKDPSDLRVNFIFAQIRKIKEELEKKGLDFCVLSGDPIKVWRQILNAKGAEEGLITPDWVENFNRLTKLIKDSNVTGIVFGSDYEPSTLLRDKLVSDEFKKNGLLVAEVKEQVMFEKSEVLKADGRPYTVFTPYCNQWLKTLRSEPMPPPVEKGGLDLMCGGSGYELPALATLGFHNRDFIFPSTGVAKGILKNYHLERDLPALNATTRLGLHLRFGTVSIQKLVRVASELANSTWLKELVWREFFKQILFHFPHVASGPFKPDYSKIRWRNHEDEFEKWKNGKTGIPIVDAGMRELNLTGHMHNRVRMIVGSFLVKHLLIDWRWGEAYFAEKLLDFDLSANNGNWQWVAGTGCDAAPYFRVFNPILQAEKFDPKQDYIRKWVPEFLSPDYPKPIVDLRDGRERALRSYAVALGKNPVKVPTE